MPAKSISAAIRAARERVVLHRNCSGDWQVCAFDGTVRAWRESDWMRYPAARNAYIEERVFQALLALGHAPHVAIFAIHPFDAGTLRDRIKSAVGRIERINA